MVEERTRLRADEHLGMPGGHLEERGDYIQSIRVKAQFWLVDDDQTWQFVLRLHQQRDEAHGPEGAIGELVRTKDLIRLLVSPVENDVPVVRAAWHEVKVVKERRDEANRADDSVVNGTPILVLQAMEESGQVPCIRQERAVVADVAVLPDASGGRRIVEVVNAAPIEQPGEETGRQVPFSTSSLIPVSWCPEPRTISLGFPFE